MKYSNRIDSLMLLVFVEDINVHQLIDNVLSASKYFDARILIGCVDSQVKNLEKVISNLRVDHKKLPLIQVCPVNGIFIEGVLHEASEYDVDLLVMQSDFHSKNVKKKQRDLLSLRKLKLLEKSKFPVLILPYDLPLNPHSLKSMLIFEWKLATVKTIREKLKAVEFQSQLPVLLMKYTENLERVA